MRPKKCSFFRFVLFVAACLRRSRSSACPTSSTSSREPTTDTTEPKFEKNSISNKKNLLFSTKLRFKREEKFERWRRGDVTFSRTDFVRLQQSVQELRTLYNDQKLIGPSHQHSTSFGPFCGPWGPDLTWFLLDFVSPLPVVLETHLKFFTLAAFADSKTRIAFPMFTSSAFHSLFFVLCTI